MEARTKRLWIVTLANIVILGLWLRHMVGAPADWLFYSLLLVGQALSVTGLWFTKGVAPGASRFFAPLINGCALALNSIFLLAGLNYVGHTEKRFFLPFGYEGDVWVVEAPDGESLNKTLWGSVVIYRIPPSGILRTQERSYEGGSWWDFYCERPDGSLDMIEGSGWIGPGESYQERPDGSVEESQNDKDWPIPLESFQGRPVLSPDEREIWLYSTTSFTTSKGCSVPIEHFYVGTKADLLSKYRKIDLAHYLHDHPILNQSDPNCR